MAVRVAINGFGRTGRAAFRAAVESGADIDWVAINDIAEPAMLAQLLKYDTVYGRFGGVVEAYDDAIVVDGTRIAAPTESDPARLPWGELDVDVVIESTGRFRSRPDADSEDGQQRPHPLAEEVAQHEDGERHGVRVLRRPRRHIRNSHTGDPRHR